MFGPESTSVYTVLGEPKATDIDGIETVLGMAYSTICSKRTKVGVSIAKDHGRFQLSMNWVMFLV